MRTSKYTLEANERIEVTTSGNYVSVRESVTDLIIENPDSGEIIEVSQGDDFQLESFDTLYITNTSAEKISIKLTVSRDKKAGSAKVGGSVSVAGDIGLNSVTLGLLSAAILDAQIIRNTNTFVRNTAITANSAVEVVAPLDNVNGVVINAASAIGFAGGVAFTALIAKATIPANITEGDVICANNLAQPGFNYGMALSKDVFIPAGLGVYFYLQGGESGALRTVLYTLL